MLRQHTSSGAARVTRTRGQHIHDTTAQRSNTLLTSVVNALGHAATGVGIEPSCGPRRGLLA
ncbi:hypothetical protein [Sorangium sp. So ce131]|uniref:hypothetical protein n=1 Tax=Sorangium sp. So ce131 TaxID=3133282 RepID=UPI003F615627